jgi:hypothetical protein
MVALALDPPACLEPSMPMAGFAVIVPEAPIMMVQVPMIAACIGRQTARNNVIETSYQAGSPELIWVIITLSWLS